MTMTSDNNPFKLLEINVISAHDLPPVSKILRTYVVAWVHPDHKLSTRVDHKGNTNPTWDYRMVFRVDDKFLRSESAAVMFEIYNVAWLRDLPFGTTRLPLQILFNNPPSAIIKPQALHISRPTGHLKGILNVSINIVNTTTPNVPLPSEISFSTIPNHDEIDDIVPPKLGNQEDYIISKLENSEKEGDVTSLSDDSFLVSSKEKSVASSGSIISGMQPLPSEVAAALKNGLYSTGGEDTRSSIFDNWTIAGDQSVDEGIKSTFVKWEDDQIPLANDHGVQKKRAHRRRHSDGPGLFSCFGNGFEFTFVCGSNSMKNNKKKMVSKSNGHVISYANQENLRGFYI